MRVYLTLLLILTIAYTPFPTGFSRIDAPTAHQRVTIVGYKRDNFGPGWQRHATGCTTREHAMAYAFEQPVCGVPYRQWAPVDVVDPYTRKRIGPGDVELDHLFPLSAAWDMGAHAWSDEQRLQFANDPHNLIVTSRAANQQKSDMLPSEWMPSSVPQQCAYARQLARVANMYDLHVTTRDLRTMRRACQGWRGVASRLAGIGMFPTANSPR